MPAVVRLPAWLLASLLALLAGPGVAAVAGQPQPGRISNPGLFTSVKALMTAVTIPASTALFNAAGETPISPAAWQQLARDARWLAESGQRLARPPLALNEGEWQRQSQALQQAASAAERAAQRQDGDALAQAGDAVYASCEGCHRQYLNKSSQSAN